MAKPRSDPHAARETRSGRPRILVVSEVGRSRAVATTIASATHSRERTTESPPRRKTEPIRDSACWRASREHSRKRVGAKEPGRLRLSERRSTRTRQRERGARETPRVLHIETRTRSERQRSTRDVLRSVGAERKTGGRGDEIPRSPRRGVSARTSSRRVPLCQGTRSGARRPIAEGDIVSWIGETQCIRVASDDDVRAENTDQSGTTTAAPERAGS